MCYGYWKDVVYETLPELTVQKQMSILHVRQFKKRISNSNSSECGRLLAKFVFSNPLVVLEQIVAQISGYENLSKSVLESMKYFHDMTFDCTVYSLLIAFSAEKSKLKADGKNLSIWFKNLSSFAGEFFRKRPEALGAILQYILNRLKDENCLEVVILQELVSRMAGIDHVEDVELSMLEGQMGGLALMAETAFKTASKKNLRRSPTHFLANFRPFRP
jgi:THO complex subunit 2